MFDRFFKKKGRSLGIATKTRTYDVPLNKGAGGRFIITLMALMTFLAVLALSASFALSEMTQRWVSGLENKASIEIPAEDENDNVIPSDAIDTYVLRINSFLKSHPAIESAETMSDEQISELVAPWLGEDMEFTNIPLPAIITLSFKKDVRFDIKALEQNIKDIAPQARLDTHESWLSQVLRFTGALNFAAILVSVVIGVTTIVAVGGSVHSRMSMYRDELELLHLMGASDEYISRQFQRYIFFIALKGAAIGLGVGYIILMIIGWFMGHMDINLIPDFSLNTLQIITLIFLIPLIAISAMVTARITVLRALALMP